jgi:phosphoglycolate phosphatase
MICKGIIFDLDGTLADTLADIAGSMNHVLKQNSYPQHAVDDYRLLVGRGLENLVATALPPEFRQAGIISVCLASFIHDYRENCLVQTSLYPGIESLLFYLQDRQLKLSVFSNKADELTQMIVRALLPGIRFNMILGAKPDVPKKPDPGGALLISRAMDVKPEETIYLGDSDVDMITATRAGMFPAGVLWGFRTAAELSQNGAKALLTRPDELFNIPDCQFQGHK